MKLNHQTLLQVSILYQLCPKDAICSYIIWIFRIELQLESLWFIIKEFSVRARYFHSNVIFLPMSQKLLQF